MFEFGKREPEVERSPPRFRSATMQSARYSTHLAEPTPSRKLFYLRWAAFRATSFTQAEELLLDVVGFTATRPRLRQPRHLADGTRPPSDGGACLPRL